MQLQRISAVQEDYLEAILALESESTRVRVRDLAERLSVHKSTVTAALKSLAEKQLIEYEPYGQIVMTRSGRRAAERVSRSHAVLKRFLADVLMIDNAKAEANACRMEHVMERDVLNRLVDFTVYMTNADKQGDRGCLDGFKQMLKMESA